MSVQKLRKQPDDRATRTFRLGFREPFDFDGLMTFFALRAIPGVESADTHYRRTFLVDGETGQFSVHKEAASLVCRIWGGTPDAVETLAARVGCMFDVDADPDVINERLVREKIMASLVVGAPGLRLPGAFDPFEVSVRAIVGQQISVKAATTIMGRIAQRYGDESEYGLLFPAAGRLAELDPKTLDMPEKRALTIKELARRVSAGELDLGSTDDDTFIEELLVIPGIGPWTAQYIELRARSNADAFLAGDLVIRKASKALIGTDNEKKILDYAQAWRPWRGYAGMHLWRYAAVLKQ